MSTRAMIRDIMIGLFVLIGCVALFGGIFVGCDRASERGKIVKLECIQGGGSWVPDSSSGSGTCIKDGVR